MGGPEQSAMNHVVHVMCGKNDIAQFRDVRVAIAMAFWGTHRKIEAEFAAGAGGAYVKGVETSLSGGYSVGERGGRKCSVDMTHVDEVGLGWLMVVGLFCRNVGLVCGIVGVLCGNVGEFAGDLEVSARGVARVL
mmetsp:Transcript_100229/g.161578  ORF Transcript_100229/g.161578 Transcript_100229/m.161578 type:complete len:135 (+) Transcript_100229:44-448(+)